MTKNCANDEEKHLQFLVHSAPNLNNLFKQWNTRTIFETEYFFNVLLKALTDLIHWNNQNAHWKKEKVRKLDFHLNKLITRASAEALIIALVTTPVCPRAAPRAKPGNINLKNRYFKNSFRHDDIKWDILLEILVRERWIRSARVST